MNFTSKKARGGTRKMLSRIRKRLTYTNVAVTLALVFAMTGGAYAASKVLITSTKQIKPSVLKQLQGKAGAQGPAGVPGTVGAAGPQGPAGAAGKDGAPGTSGSPGESVTSAALTAGDAACNKEGGSKFTVGGKETLACNGKSGFTEVLPSGDTEHGTWAAAGEPGKTVLGEVVMAPVSFNIPLSEAPSVHVIPMGTPEGSDPAGCAGTFASPHAEPGNLCVFVTLELNVRKGGGVPEFLPFDPETNEGGVGKSGTAIVVPAAGAGAVLAYGVWVVTAK